jgi:hypothetical protein
MENVANFPLYTQRGCFHKLKGYFSNWMTTLRTNLLCAMIFKTIHFHQIDKLFFSRIPVYPVNIKTKNT